MKRTLSACVFLLTLGACASHEAPPKEVPPTPAPSAHPAAPNVAHFDWFTYEGRDPVYQAIKRRPGTYLNPILAGFYPDPSVVRVGKDYYLVNSTFSYFPGIPVFHSIDLVHWTQIGNAIDRPEQLKFDGLGMSRGVFAPSISMHNGKFYIINTCVDCGGNFFVTATNPAGPWSDPVWLPFEGIDPSFFFDRDGKTYIVNNGMPAEKPLYDGHRAIWLQGFDPATNRMTGPRRVIVDGGPDIRKKPVWIEGPHLFRAGGFYYLICAEGGTGTNHSEVVFRSKRVFGPYVPYRDNPILTQRNLNPARPFPVTSTGHAQLVRTQTGRWWAVFLGTRPYADDDYNTGRETFLLPVRWRKSWPEILPPDKPVPYAERLPNLPSGTAPIPTSGNFTLRDAFDGTALAPYWLFARTPREKWYELGGGLAIQTRPDSIGSMGQPSFIGRRQQHGWASAAVEMHYTPAKDGERAGLVAFQNSAFYYFLGIERHEGTVSVRVEKRAGDSDPENGIVTASATVASGAPLYLKIEERGDKYDFYYGTEPGAWIPLMQGADGTILSTHLAGGFVGTIIGMYAYAPSLEATSRPSP